MLLVLSTTLVYFNSLKGSFQFDDVPLIKSHWLENTDAFYNHPRSGQIGNRPVLYWTYALNNQLARHQVFGFHLVNLALHIGVTLLIFFTLWRTRHLQNENGWGFPLTAALLFALHPINTDSVSYISSRSSVLTTFFYLLTLYIFLNLFCLKKITRIAKGLVISLLVLSGIYLSVATKLIGVTLPLMLVVWYWSFIGRQKYPDFHKTVFNRKSIAIGLISAALISIGFVFYADSWLYMPLDQGFELFGRTPYFMVQLKVIVFYYLRLFFFPFNLNVDSGFPFSSPMTDPAIIFSGLIIFTIIVAVLKWKNVWVIAGFIWFFITLAPTSSFVPLNDLAVEHRMYLPMSLGLGLIAGVGINFIPALWRLRLLVVLLAAFGMTTLTRNADWVSELSLWEDSAMKNPFSPRSQNNLGKAYFEKGDLIQAGFHFEKSVANIPKFVTNQYNIQDPERFLERKRQITGEENKQESPDSLKIMAELVEPHYNLASVYLDQGRLDEAEKEYLKTLLLRPQHFSATMGLGSVYNKKGLYPQAMATFQKAIREKIIATGEDRFPLAHLNLGEVYGKIGQISLAIEEWKLAIEQDPSLLPAHFNLGTAFMMQAEFSLAESTFLKCLELNDKFEPALFNLALVKQKQKQWRVSIDWFENYLAITGPRPSALTQIGFNFLNLNDDKSAKTYLENSLSLRSNDLNTLILLGDTLINLGQVEKAKEQYRSALRINKDSKLKEILRTKINKFSENKIFTQ